MNERTPSVEQQATTPFVRAGFAPSARLRERLYGSFSSDIGNIPWSACSAPEVGKIGVGVLNVLLVFILTLLIYEIFMFPG